MHFYTKDNTIYPYPSIQWTGSNFDKVLEFCSETLKESCPERFCFLNNKALFILSVTGDVIRPEIGDWITYDGAGIYSNYSEFDFKKSYTFLGQTINTNNMQEHNSKQAEWVGTDEQTYGQKAVGINFNPSNIDDVSQSKFEVSKLIDLMNDLRNITKSQEQKRLCSIAITELQSAQMWVVKALTWKD